LGVAAGLDVFAGFLPAEFVRKIGR